jgi:DNA-binding transcriptional MerR regulator
MSAATPDSAEYRVTAVAQRLGIATATLRSWNRRYGIGPQYRRGRHRYYTEADIAVTATMLELINAGASPASAARAASQAHAPLPPAGDREPLLAAAFQLDTAAVSSILEAHLRHHGVVATWDKLCRPAFADIIVKQSAGEGCIDVEHLLSWAIATSLHRAAPPPPGPARHPIILACTSGETHSLPLEALRAALAERAIDAHMLGATVPTSALKDALLRHDQPVTVVLGALRAETARISAIHAALAGHARVLAAGPGWAGTHLPASVLRVDDLVEALQLLS